MQILRAGDRAKRNDNGREVSIRDVQPIGSAVVYLTEDRQTGDLAIIAHDRLRPVNATENEGA